MNEINENIPINLNRCHETKNSNLNKCSLKVTQNIVLKCQTISYAYSEQDEL